MTQPPDERPPDQPASDGGPENEPTVAWTPPEPDPAIPPDQGGVGYAAIPDEGASASAEAPPVPPSPNMPTEPPAAPPETPADASPVATSPPAGPIISAAPTEPNAGWQTPPPAVPPVVAGSGWQVPPAAAAAVATTQDGYVISGVGSRIVAWLIDGTLVGIVPLVLLFALFDWSGTFQKVFDQLRVDPTGRTFTATQISSQLTLNYILVTLIALGIQYLYFVGFWTSRWRATPGMIGLKMRVVDATSGGDMSLVQATKRWIGLGWPLGLLAFVPGLSQALPIIEVAYFIVLFFTVVTNDRRQGLHDRWANSLVIRHTSSGSGATAVGCVIWGVMVILLVIVVWAVVFAAMAPYLQDYIRNLPSPTP